MLKQIMLLGIEYCRKKEGKEHCVTSIIFRCKHVEKTDIKVYSFMSIEVVFLRMHYNIHVERKITRSRKDMLQVGHT